MVSEDIVQDVLLNWINHTPEGVQHVKAWLARSVINATLNHLDRIKRQREIYKGHWLPEPVLTGHHAVDARLDISYGFMLLLEKLTPMERAVFVLKESFDVTYAEIAQMFETAEANCRQLYKRAKEKLGSSKRRFSPDPQQQQALLRAFTSATETGNIHDFIQLLKHDVVLYSDGGGKVAAALNTLVGLDVVGHFFRSLDQKFGHNQDTRAVLVNGQVALLITLKDTQQVDTLLILDGDSSGIQQLFAVRNPDKLAHLQK
ncbi:RNA polymerase sigma-70 factor [Spirosoma flavus]